MSDDTHANELGHACTTYVLRMYYLCVEMLHMHLCMYGMYSTYTCLFLSGGVMPSSLIYGYFSCLWVSLSHDRQTMLHRQASNLDIIHFIQSKTTIMCILGKARRRNTVLLLPLVMVSFFCPLVLTVEGKG
jgi:hypothetical protein